MSLPLVDAVVKGNLAAVQDHLLKQPAQSVNDPLLFGWSSLHWAARHGHGQILKALIAANGNVHSKDKDGCTLMHDAAGWGHVHIVDILLDSGVGVSTRDNFGWTPLHDAAREGHLAVVERLVRAGADLDARDQDGKSPLDLAVTYKHEEVASFLKLEVRLKQVLPVLLPLIDSPEEASRRSSSPIFVDFLEQPLCEVNLFALVFQFVC